MNISVFGATGLTGLQVVEQALKAGHRVTAVVRDPNRLPISHDRLTVVVADLDDDLEPALKDADAVVPCLGHRPKEPGGLSIVSQGTRRIVAAMTNAGVRRLVTYTAGPVEITPSPGRPNPPKHDPAHGFFTRHVMVPLLNRVLGPVYVDCALAEDALRDSSLDWTVIRPPRLLNKPVTGRYRKAIDAGVRRGFSISRADLAHALLAAIDDPSTIRHWVGIGY